MSIIDEIFQLFEARGQGAYFGEAVTQTEHALQAAHLAASAGAGDALVCAALLHDVGHLLHGLGEDVADRGVDAGHEGGGAAWLARHFGPAVTEPVRLHVAAKRYLCAIEPAYEAGLSPASRQSLRLQGGPMTAAEAAAFERGPHGADAVALRHWDDGAKIPGLTVPGLQAYRARLEAALREGPRQGQPTRRTGDA
jgi:phosphonate degradation associated HDIG domain protein